MRHACVHVRVFLHACVRACVRVCVPHCLQSLRARVVAGSQTELLRQILSQKAVYSATRPVLTPVEDVAFVAAATAPAAIGECHLSYTV